MKKEPQSKASKEQRDEATARRAAGYIHEYELDAHEGVEGEPSPS